MKFPFAILIGKSLNDVVDEALRKEPLGKRMQRNNLYTGYVRGWAIDENIKKGFAYLPLVERLSKEVNSGKKHYKLNVAVVSYQGIFPNQLVATSRKDKCSEQIQVIVSDDGVVLRRVTPQPSYKGGMCAQVIYAHGDMFRSCREFNEQMIKAFIEEAFANTSEYTSGFDLVREGDSYKLDAKLLIPETELDKKSLEKLKERSLMPSTAKPLYPEIIKPTLQELGYEPVVASSMTV